MFERVLSDLLVTLNRRWHHRQQRPLPLSMAHTNQHFRRIWIVDASTLEALFRKLKSLESSTLGKLGGRICAVIDLKTRYPVQTWFDERPYAHESNFVPQLLELVSPKTLLLLDRGFWNYSLFERLILAQSDFITRLKSNAKYESISILSQSSTHRDERWSVPTTFGRRIGEADWYVWVLVHCGNPILDLRLVEIRHGHSWYRYLTSVLEPDILPPYVVGDLYSRRWRIEESFLLLKRLLGLSYLWTGEPLRWAGSPT